MLIKIFKQYQKLKSMPDDPEYCESYGLMTNTFQSFVKEFPIPLKYVMPLDEKIVINSIHECLGDEQGLIEVKTGKTKNGSNFVYSIIKTHMQPSGMQYFLRMHVFFEKYIIEINAFFDETGTTGVRDSTIFALLKMTNKDKWFKDPYDEKYKKGIPMNLSEDEKYDKMFPGHPLSVCRELLRFITENN